MRCYGGGWRAMTEAPETTPGEVAGHVRDRGVAFALVGGLAGADRQGSPGQAAGADARGAPTNLPRRSGFFASGFGGASAQ